MYLLLFLVPAICAKPETFGETPWSLTLSGLSGVDRTLNVEIYGIDENGDQDVWMPTVQRVVNVAAGRRVQIVDAYRMGLTYCCPILVKLQSINDTRAVINGARKLGRYPEFRGRVFIKADEPVEVRRQETLLHLKAKAERQGETVTVSADGLLTIGGEEIGYIRPDIIAGINNLYIDKKGQYNIRINNHNTD